jgi:hypothetical protein
LQNALFKLPSKKRGRERKRKRAEKATSTATSQKKPFIHRFALSLFALLYSLFYLCLPVCDFQKGPFHPLT